MAGGGVQKIYMVFLREPSRRDRSGSDLFHLWDGFEIKMNFDRNVSCFIFVNALIRQMDMQAYPLGSLPAHMKIARQRVSATKSGNGLQKTLQTISIWR